jgi:hypothetical protein
MEYKALIKLNYANDGEFAGDFSLDFSLCFILVIRKQHERSLKVSALYVIIVLDFDPIKIFHTLLLCYFNILQAVQATASNM